MKMSLQWAKNQWKTHSQVSIIKIGKSSSIITVLLAYFQMILLLYAIFCVSVIGSQEQTE